jgi:hypothetical protein
MRKILPLLLLLPLSACKHTKQITQAPAPNQTAISTISIGHEGEATFPVVDNARFYIIPDYMGNDKKTVNLTLTEHIVTHVRTDRECCEAEISVSGSIDGRDVWTARKKASHAEMFDRFYRTITPGCCGSATRYAYFDPLTGNQSFIATEPIASLSLVGLNNSLSYSRYLVLNRISEPGDEQLVIQIQYGPQSGPSQVAYLIHPGQDTAVVSTSVHYFKDGKLTKANTLDQEGIFPSDFTLFPPGYPLNGNTSPDQITGFSFVLNLENDVVKIPVVKDGLDFNHATLPGGFQVSEKVPADSAKYLQEMLK